MTSLNLDYINQVTTPSPVVPQTPAEKIKEKMATTQSGTPTIRRDAPQSFWSKTGNLLADIGKGIVTDLAQAGGVAAMEIKGSAASLVEDARQGRDVYKPYTSKERIKLAKDSINKTPEGETRIDTVLNAVFSGTQRYGKEMNVNFWGKDIFPDTPREAVAPVAMAALDIATFIPGAAEVTVPLKIALKEALITGGDKLVIEQFVKGLGKKEIREITAEVVEETGKKLTPEATTFIKELTKKATTQTVKDVTKTGALLGGGSSAIYGFGEAIKNDGALDAQDMKNILITGAIGTLFGTTIGFTGAGIGAVITRRSTNKFLNNLLPEAVEVIESIADDTPSVHIDPVQLKLLRTEFKNAKKAAEGLQNTKAVKANLAKLPEVTTLDELSKIERNFNSLQGKVNHYKKNMQPVPENIMNELTKLRTKVDDIRNLQASDMLPSKPRKVVNAETKVIEADKAISKINPLIAKTTKQLSIKGLSQAKKKVLTGKLETYNQKLKQYTKAKESGVVDMEVLGSVFNDEYKTSLKKITKHEADLKVARKQLQDLEESPAYSNQVYKERKLNRLEDKVLKIAEDKAKAKDNYNAYVNAFAKEHNIPKEDVIRYIKQASKHEAAKAYSDVLIEQAAKQYNTTPEMVRSNLEGKLRAGQKGVIVNEMLVNASADFNEISAAQLSSFAFNDPARLINKIDGVHNGALYRGAYIPAQEGKAAVITAVKKVGEDMVTFIQKQIGEDSHFRSMRQKMGLGGTPNIGKGTQFSRFVHIEGEKAWKENAADLAVFKGLNEADQKAISNTADHLSVLFKQWLPEINEMLKLQGKEPIIGVKDYFRRIREDTSFLDELRGIFKDKDKLVETSYGTSVGPSLKGVQKHRTGGKVNYDAIGGAMDYAGVHAEQMHMTKPLLNIRTIAVNLFGPDKPNAQKALLDFADGLSGVRTFAGNANPGEIAQKTGRFLQLYMNVRSTAAFALSARTTVIQFSNITSVTAQKAGEKNVSLAWKKMFDKEFMKEIKELPYTIIRVGKGAFPSEFKNNVAVYDDYARAMTTYADNITTLHSLTALKLKGQDLGMSGKALNDWVQYEGAQINGHTAKAFQAKIFRDTFFANTIAPWQNFSTNMFSHVFRDIPLASKTKTAMAISYAKLFTRVSLTNEAYNAMGFPSPFDPTSFAPLLSAQKAGTGGGLINILINPDDVAGWQAIGASYDVISSIITEDDEGYEKGVLKLKKTASKAVSDYVNAQFMRSAGALEAILDNGDYTGFISEGEAKFNVWDDGNIYSSQEPTFLDMVLLIVNGSYVSKGGRDYIENLPNQNTYNKLINTPKQVSGAVLGEESPVTKLFNPESALLPPQE